MKTVDAILFDLGDTLVHFETSRAKRFLERGTRPAYDRLREWGFDPPPYDRYLRAVKRRFLRAFVWSRLIRREARLVDAFERMHRLMGIHLRTDQMNDLVLQCVMPLRGFFAVDRDAGDVVERLAAAGYRLGLVSNTLFPGIGIDDVLREAGLLHRFPVRVYSSDVGYMKPHRRIFRTAVERMGVPAERTLFIGDRVDKDVRGPARVGMKTMLIARNGHAPRGGPPPDFIVRGLREVPPVLEASQPVVKV